MTSRCLYRRRPPLLHVRCYRTKGSKNKETLLEPSGGNVEQHISPKIPARKSPDLINHGPEHHQDMASFLTYATRQNLATTSTTYQGTLYEYTVASSIKRLGFEVHRTGKSSDHGIDLIGWWHLTASTKSDTDENSIRVIISCKALAKKAGPQYFRELEGSFSGAPAQWQGRGVIGFLVASKEATKGMRDAMTRSRMPLGFMQITEEGNIVQMLWNQQASQWGLEGFGVTMKFGPQAARGGKVEQEIVLTRHGRAVDNAKEDGA